MHDSYLAKGLLLLDIAPLVFRQPNFAMKGGTAINLFFRDMPRLSVDIDLVYTRLDHTNRQEALSEITDGVTSIAEAIHRLPGTQTRTKPAIPKKEAETTIFVSRRGVEVKVEINTVFRGTVYPVSPAQLSARAQQQFRRAVTVPVLDRDELYGSKLVAALDRQHPRDLFDISILMHEGDIPQRMRRAFVVYLAGHNRPMHELLPPSLSDLQVSFASEFQGMTRDEVSLIQLESARAWLLSQLPSQLDNEERQFLLSIKSLEPQWSLLGIPDIDKLPAVQWKLRNLEKLRRANAAKYRQMLASLRQRLEL